MSGGGGTNTVQKSDPWSGVQPYLTDLFSKAQNYVNGAGPQYYPGSTVAPQSSQTQLAKSLMEQRALMGNPLTSQAQQQASDTLTGRYLTNPTTGALLDMGNGQFSNPGLKPLVDSAAGKYLNSNPYVDSMFNKAAGQVGRQFSQNVLPGVASMFSGAGRYGSNQMTNSVDQVSQNYGKTLDDLATQIYGGNYAQERQLQQGAGTALGGLSLGSLNAAGDQYGRERTLTGLLTTQAPGLAAADYNDPMQLAKVGGSNDAYAQSLLNSDMSRWDFNQNLTGNQLAFFSNLLNGAGGLGGTTTKNTTGGGNALGNALGYGMMGSAIYNNLGGAGLFGGATDAAASAALLDGLASVGTGVAGMTYADALAAGLIAL